MSLHSDHTPPSAPETSPETLSAERPIRVLAVDDDPMVLDLIAVMLKAAPDIDLVARASDGDQAVDAVIAHHPDVVLMDLKMTRVDGIAATRAVCARPNAPRVVILTSFDDADLVPQAMEAGAIGFTLKVTAKDDLYATIRAAHSGSSPMSPQSAAHLRAGYLNGPGADRAIARRKVETLSAREREVAELVTHELTNADIARQLLISESTVKATIANLQNKLDANGRVGITRVFTLGK